MTRLIRLVRTRGEAWLSSRLILAGSRENLSLPSESIFLKNGQAGLGEIGFQGLKVFSEFPVVAGRWVRVVRVFWLGAPCKV